MTFLRRSFVMFCLLLTSGWVLAGSYEDFFAGIRQDNRQDIQELLDRGFDPNTLSPDGVPALLVAITQDSSKVIDLLIRHPLTDVDVRNSKDETPLMLFALRGNVQRCTELVGRDADVNKPGWTPLHYAATGGHVEVIRLLIEAHAYIDASSPNESTPLMMAAMYGTSSAVKVLLEAGADPTIKNALGLTAIDFAQRVKKQESADIIAAFVRARRPKGTW